MQTRHGSLSKSRGLSQSAALCEHCMASFERWWCVLPQVSDADKTRQLVEESWALVEQDLEAHGVAFFLKIFEIAPAALQLFSFKGKLPAQFDPPFPLGC